MRGGLLIAVGGVWLLCQVLGGNALGRLGLVGSPARVREAETKKANDAAVSASAKVSA